MRRSGGAAIRMQKNFKDTDGALSRMTFLVGDGQTIAEMQKIPARPVFDECVIDFLSDLSKNIRAQAGARSYPDVVTFGFWLRRSSLLRLKERFENKDGNMHMGRGVVFHIAPSNVPVNYAYSLAAGLLTGNLNIVRVPSKEFPQVSLINRAIRETLAAHENMKPYIALVRYGHERDVNDLLSSMADVRVIWGGDATIEEIRRSQLRPGAGEITFADRYSLAVIDSGAYLAIGDRKKAATDFYNDTFLTDQNACTSPRIVVWLGSSIAEAKELFWETLHALAAESYAFQPIQGVNKLTSAYLLAAAGEGAVIEPREDNLIVRVKVRQVSPGLMEFKDHSGYFFEYDCRALTELFDLCNDRRCQTIGYLGDVGMFDELLAMGPRGIDRLVPIGRTMDFELIWDGYDLTERLSRTVRIVQ